MNPARWGVFFVALAFGSAKDAALLWDVSKSVPLELYSPLVRTTVESLIAGTKIPDGWDVTLAPDAPKELEDLVSGRIGLRQGSGELLVIHFGTLNRTGGSPNMPFRSFSMALTGGPEDPASARRFFPSAATDDWTNKLLAEACGARYFFDRKKQAWFSVMISDFNEDSKERLTESEIAFLDAYRSQQFVSVSPPVVLRLRASRQTQIELKLVTAKAPTDAPPDIPQGGRMLEPIAPRQNASLPNGKQIVFSWRWNREKKPESFSLVVTRAGVPGAVFSRSTSATSVTTPSPLESGSYRWQVFALENGASVASAPAVAFDVEGGSGGLFLLLILAAIAAGLLWLIRMRSRKRRGE